MRKILKKFQESLKLCFYLKNRIKKNLYQLFIPGVNLKHVLEEYFLMINKTVLLEFNGLQFYHTSYIIKSQQFKNVEIIQPY